MERINNYYNATRNDFSEHPALEDDLDVDVAIVGGGSTGLATAVELCEKGLSVVLLESHRIGWGASGRNGGQVTGSLSGDANILKQLKKRMGSEAIDVIRLLRWHGHDIIRHRIEKYSIDCDLRFGHLHTAYSKSDVAELQKSVQDAQEAGLGDDIQWLDKSEVREKLGTNLYHGGVYNRRNMHVHSLNLCLGEAAAATSLGAKIFEQSHVLNIEYGDHPRLVTKEGSVRAKTIILAGNAHHRLAQHALRGLLFPAILGNLTTEPLSEDAVNEINPERLAVYDSRMILDYFRVTADNRLMFGGGTNYSGKNIDDVAKTLRPSLEMTFPQLQGVNIDYAWTGTAGIIINRIPALGRIDDNVYYAQGYSGHGIASSHIMAEILADKLTGNHAMFDLISTLKHTRLPVGPKIGSAIIALGMLYHRLKQ